jgi:hypothetical protein
MVKAVVGFGASISRKMREGAGQIAERDGRLAFGFVEEFKSLPTK